ncbi:MAG: YncE family protein [bacterium]
MVCKCWKTVTILTITGVIWAGQTIIPNNLNAQPYAYVTNSGSNNVSVIDTRTNAVVGSPIPVGVYPYGIAITPDGNYAYVTNAGSDNVSVIDTRTNAVVGSPIPVGDYPIGIAITPDGNYAYVTNLWSDNVSVIDTSTNAVVGSPIPVGDGPWGIAITPDGNYAYVTNRESDNVSVIDTSTNAVVGSPIPVGDGPVGIAITPMVVKEIKIDIILNQTEFTVGDTLTIAAHVTNGPATSTVDAKVWLELPTTELFSLVNIPSITLLPDAEFSVDLFTHHFTGWEPEGNYKCGGRFLNWITGETLSEDIETFTFTP